MRAIVVRAFGAPEVLVPEEIPRPEPGAGQVLVRIHSAGVNFADTERRRELYQAVELPWVPGSEGAGVVEAVGPEVDADLVGRRVAVFGHPSETTGTYAEWVAADRDRVLPLPEAIGFDTGAAFLAQGLTAWHLLHTATSLRAGQTVLVHAAAGGVGLLLVQLARRAGARVFGTVSSLEKAQRVEEAGGEPLLYGDDLALALTEATDGKGIDLVLDSVGRATQAVSFAALGRFGHLLFFGESSGAPAPFEPDHLYDRSISIGAFTLWDVLRGSSLEAESGGLVEAVADGSLKLTIGGTWPLAEASEAHRALESRATVGKVLLRVD